MCVNDFTSNRLTLLISLGGDCRNMVVLLSMTYNVWMLKGIRTDTVRVLILESRKDWSIRLQLGQKPEPSKSDRFEKWTFHLTDPSAA